jgi:hypothetical protein
VTRSFLEILKPNNFNDMDMYTGRGGETLERSTEMAAIREKETR